MVEQVLPDECPESALAELIEAAKADDVAGIEQVDGLLARYPQDARLHFLRGSLLAGLKRYAEADQSMRRAVEIAPGFDVARFQLGLLQLSSGDAAAAQATLAGLQRPDADDALSLFGRGLSHLMRDEFPQTIELLKAGISVNHANPAINRDMELIIDQVQEKLSSGGRETGEPEVSETHLLLQQYGSKPTKH